ncbi:hypothetical protein AUJ14_05960 [Candidatus Micrarchaeota archaeon CG1_02_55_22]|nr:MAG: hypothetical protein AUJ14_05960 [Candidatus Micrarchaeota archaeon CG1_02_55_22]
MARKQAFKGLEEAQLKALSPEEFLKLVPSKARRAITRASLQYRKCLAKFRKAKESGKVMKTHYRQMVILPEMLGARIQVHDGKQYVEVAVVPEMMGRRLGEFAITTKMVKHSGPGIGATRGSKAVELK